MTDEQLDILRNIIQKEISYAIENDVNEKWWAYTIADDCDKLWDSLKETFNDD